MQTESHLDTFRKKRLNFGALHHYTQQMLPETSLLENFLPPSNANQTELRVLTILVRSFVRDAGSTLKSWLRAFLSFCFRHFKVPKIYKRAQIVSIPKSLKPVENNQKDIPNLSALFSLQDFRATYLHPRQTSHRILCSNRNRLIFDAKKPSRCSCKASRTLRGK